MDVKQFFETIIGNWQGTYRLWMDPNHDPENSSTKADIRFLAGNHYVLFTYTWEQGGKIQEGVFLLGGRNETASASWGDSFHMTPHPMICEGALIDDGQTLILNGHYAGGDEQWGWRTELILETPNKLTMKAFNITPQGEECIAVISEMEK